MELNDSSALILGPAGRSSTPVYGAPRVSAAVATLLREIIAVDEQGAEKPLSLVIERPLTLTLDGREVVTLMTLGAAPEWLVLGYLRNHRLVEEVTSLRSVEVDWTRGAALVSTRQGRIPPGGAPSPLACSLGTSFVDVMDRLGGGGGDGGGEDGAAPQASLSRAALLEILDSMRRYDAIHRAAGSVHSCALFRGSELWVAVEDVSRHNGVDTICGFMNLHGVGGADKVLFTTGRLTSEMVLKAAHNGIPILISRNGTTAMAYELAAKLGITLIGRAANRRYLCYIGAQRIDLG